MPLTPEEATEHSLQFGDLIYGESSLVRSGIAKTLPVVIGGEGTIFAWHTRRLELDLHRADPVFISEALSSKPVRRIVEGRATQTALTGMTVADYLSTPLPLPELPEQQSISAHLGEADRAISAALDERNQLQQAKSGLLQDLLTGKVRVSV